MAAAEEGRAVREPEDHPEDVVVLKVTGAAALPRVAGRLCNFATNKSALWPEHAAWLRGNVVPPLRDPRGAWVDILAYASNRGDVGRNQKLSERRRDAVLAFLKAETGNPELPVNISRGFGETAYTGGDPRSNYGWDRAVDVYVYGGPQPQRPPPVRIGSIRFKIRCVGGFAPGAAIPGVPGITPGGDFFLFEIVDLEKREAATFVYRGMGFGVGVPLPKIKVPFHIPGVSAGDYAEFDLTNAADLPDFDGPADLITHPGASVPWKSVGGDVELRFNSVDFVSRGVRVRPKGRVEHLPGYVRMGTGAGIGMPGLGGTTKGKIEMWPGMVQPYTGP